MNFSNELNNYIEILHCTSKDICDISGLSPALVSRYLNGKRTPRIGSTYFDKIVDALYQIATNKKINVSKESIYKKLVSSIDINEFTFDYFIKNSTKIQNKLNISTVELSKALGYDSSFLSRIKNKERRPSDLDSFVENYADYVINICQSNEKKKILIDLLESDKVKMRNPKDFKQDLINWLTQSNNENYLDNSTSVLNFMNKLESFNLNDYISTDFSKIKVPSSPIVFKNSKTFFGTEGRKKAEAEFLRTTLLSKSKEPIFLYSNLPITEAGKDEKFTKKVVLATTMILKKGLHLNMIHTVDRPLNELIMGFENWLPIYMTGYISPYYFETPPSNFFLGSHWVSGSAALLSQSLQSNENTSMFYLTTKKDEVKYARDISKYMLSKAKPLMKIFKDANNDDFKKFLQDNKDEELIKVQKEGFKNINFWINKNKWVMINKNTNPEIHFVIYNEQLRDAIVKFVEEPSK